MNEPVKIFIVDSSHTFIRSVEQSLKSAHWEIEWATSASSGMMRIIRWHPSLLITGIEVGQINGFDLCLILKLMPDYVSMPIVIISSNTTELAQRQAADVGADFYLHKDANVLVDLAAFLTKRFSIGVNPPAPKREVHRVLVVDDSKVMRRIIRNILASVGIDDIVEAGDGQQALKQLELARVDLIMTDWTMPVMNGLEFVKAVRKLPQWASTPIVMVTTEAGKSSVAEALAAGIDGHLCKPFSQQSMKEIIARFTAPR